MKLVLTEFVSLDGVSQGPGSPTEDTSDGFTRGGWLVPYLEHPGEAVGLRIVEQEVTPSGLVVLEYEPVGAAPVAEYEGVTAFV